ncbi:MAG: Rv1355c family protein [Flavobacteriales bacterium]|nr:Rv1355c family protein [Flavobacteriales bacterium]
MGESFDYNLLATDNEYVKSLSYVPDFFDIRQKNHQKLLTALLKSRPDIQIIDEIDSQLEELIKLRNPRKKFTTEELQSAVSDFLGDCPKADYGQWVYYPWLNKLIHLLDRDEYIEVRTNRNQYKITPEEEITLTGKKIGIIGLSVGKAIALTIATERICGELVLADFDVIELSNLNRIQTGVQNFGLKKTVMVAREIAEIDPYLNVTCYHDGLTESNADDFFSKNGKLDICIEVCDGLYAKIFARQKARAFGIPVVMNSSDRGTTDIERYDLDPNLPILHGLIDHLDLNKVKEAKTNEEKVPYLLPMLGVESSSERLKASMLEIEETITTWPQLASGVIFGGGICTDVCRRILLGQFTKSGRYFVDVEDATNNEVEDYISQSGQNATPTPSIPPTSFDQYTRLIEQYANESDPGALELPKSVVEQLVEAAAQAPSGGNIQPWKWVYKNKSLLLFLDENRSHSILNYQNTAALISLGAASENLILEGSIRGIQIEPELFPDYPNELLVARFTCYKQTETDQKQAELAKQIGNRVTNRSIKSCQALSEDQLNRFSTMVCNNPALNLMLFKDKNQIDAIKDVLMEVDRLYYTSKTGHMNFIREIRWTPEEATFTRDGIDLRTIELTPTEAAGFEVSRNWNVVRHTNNWKLGKSFSRLTEKGFNAASAIGMIVAPREIIQSNYFDGGRFMERIWLNACTQDIAIQPMSISAFLFARSADRHPEGIESISTQLLALENQLKGICNLPDEKRVMFIFRITRAGSPTIKSLRRPIEEVLHYDA